jgi:IclR family transcriptional regulator, acetate operon repressor
MTHDPILEKLFPFLDRLRQKTRKTIVIGKRLEDKIVYLDELSGLEFIRFNAETGETRPLGVSAIGKAILASVPAKDFNSAIGQMPFTAITDRTITSADKLSREIEESRNKGYFITKGEYALEVMSIAASCNIGGELIGFAIIGPLSRLEPVEAELARALLKTKSAILASDELGPDP